MKEEQQMKYLAYKRLERKFIKVWKGLDSKNQSSIYNSWYAKKTDSSPKFMDYFLTINQ